MPTYAYKCKKCGKSFTLVLSITEHDRKKPTCPKCRSSQVAQTVQGFFATTSKKS
ncbi:MAG: zinc ribbon domain-containing protein [Verrucomicrobia bacterium]|nr:zinc ribbon domain-containing protein [Verrucomicrobiota bacterium]